MSMMKTSRPAARRRRDTVPVGGFPWLLAAQVLFLGSIALTIAFGLVWALNPEPSRGIGFRPGGSDVGPAATAEPEAAPQATAPAGEPGQETSPEPTEEPTEDPAELLAAARPPRETSVQVLDAGGGSQAMQTAAAALRDLGYNVVNTTSSRSHVDRTTVWWSEGNEAEARALRAREARVRDVDRNQRLNEGVNLHVLVGDDWGG
jgi:hypothetical protein